MLSGIACADLLGYMQVSIAFANGKLISLQSDDFLCAGRSGLKAQQACMYSEYTPSSRAKLSSRPLKAFVP